ncbi:fluoride efflux transporter CrcB [Sphingosinithalassobacter portus]|uniref:fluoride efflux transporter CrcB n=1 Tax=Stakelama portus TaxID=2676234 RepID=UPI000D6DF581|nr:fluoride efflux transporter CrcB [Sphingosinithalassobacter portus]
MLHLLIVMLGGAIGAGGRHMIGKLSLLWFGPGYPWGTLAANLIGGLLMGLLVGAMARVGAGGEQWRLFLGTGILGGFTTFSTFSLDAMVMIERGDWTGMLGYVLISVIGAIAAVAAGLTLVRALA